MAPAVRIGARPSQLALIQAGLVRGALQAAIPGLQTAIVPIKTSGDRIQTPSLADIGGKGLFIKELEQALTERRVDLAVHSMKDLPAVLAPAFRIAATPERDDPRDALITRAGLTLAQLPDGARLGTSSSRRRFMALRANGAVSVVALRGNIDTRISRVERGELDAIVLAMAGLNRMRRIDVKFQVLDEREFVPAAAQGALAVEALADGLICSSGEVERAVAAMNDPRTAAETAAERAFLASIHASCTTPVGVKGTFSGGELSLRALLFSTDGARAMWDQIARTVAAGDSPGAAALGEGLASRMLAQGARELLGDG